MQRHGHVAAGLNAHKLVILQDVYDSPEARQHIPAMCQALTEAAGIGVVALEGATGEVSIPVTVDTLRGALDYYPGLSVAAINTLFRHFRDVRFEGVDDMSLHKQGRAAQTYLGENRRKLSNALAPLLEWALRAQRLYSEDIASLRRSVLKIYGEKGTLTERVELVRRIAGELGVDLRQLTLFDAFQTTLRVERTLDFALVKEQRSSLLRRWVEQLAEAVTPDSAECLDSTSSAGLLTFYARYFSIPAPEMLRAIELRGLATVLDECNDTLKRWTLSTALDLSETGESNQMSSGILLGSMLDALRAMGRDVDDLDQLAAYAEYVRLAQHGIDRHALLQELPQWSELLVDAHARQAPGSRDLIEIENSLELLVGGLRLSLSPEAAEKIELQRATLEDVLQRLDRLCPIEGGVASFWTEIAVIAKGLERAEVFYRTSRQRGEAMARGATRLFTQHKTDRAILIAGGFHTRSVEDALEDLPQLSWSVISPNVRVPHTRDDETDDGPSADL